MRSHLTIVFLAVAFVTGVSQHVKAQSQRYPPPGQMIDIGGRKLHLYCTGKGSPTVILVAGGGAFSIDWALVQPKVAEHTRVCSYDRAGLGWSDAGPNEETVEETINDLHALLRASGEKGPFIFVGASIGESSSKPISELSRKMSPPWFSQTAPIAWGSKGKTREDYSGNSPKPTYDRLSRCLRQ